MAELEPIFRQMLITRQCISSHPSADELKNLALSLLVRRSRYQLDAGTSVALTALYIMKICKVRELLDLALQAHGGRSWGTESEV